MTKLVKGGMKLNKTILLIGVTNDRPYGTYQVGYIKGKGFKVRDLDAIKANGGEWSWLTNYYPTLKQAIKAIK